MFSTKDSEGRNARCELANSSEEGPGTRAAHHDVRPLAAAAGAGVSGNGVWPCADDSSLARRLACVEGNKIKKATKLNREVEIAKIIQFSRIREKHGEGFSLLVMML
jgi:hypothetical protein